MNFAQSKQGGLVVDAHSVDAVARLVKCVLLSIVAHIVLLHFPSWSVLTYVSGGFQGAAVVRSTLMFVSITQPVKQEVLSTINTQAPSEAMGRTVEKQGVDLVRRASVSDAFQNFYPAAQLTRLPFPLTEIDLNVDNIDEVARGGQIELSILIDELGKVVDVSVMEGEEGASVFAERVAKRFSDSKFSPGEINGQQVKSQLLISVISEPRLSAEGF